MGVGDGARFKRAMPGGLLKGRWFMASGVTTCLSKQSGPLWPKPPIGLDKLGDNIRLMPWVTVNLSLTTGVCSPRSTGRTAITSCESATVNIWPRTGYGVTTARYHANRPAKQNQKKAPPRELLPPVEETTGIP